MVWCKIHILVATITDGDATSHSEKLQVLFATKNLWKRLQVSFKHTRKCLQLSLQISADVNVTCHRDGDTVVSRNINYIIWAQCLK